MSDERAITNWHVITGEYPPAPGGVSDYSAMIAAGLASAGDTVHVWCPEAPGQRNEHPGITVHPIAGRWSRGDLARVDRELSAQDGPRRLLIQWVPHAFGARSMNVAFCRWVRRRSQAGDIVELMVHEPYLAFGEGSLKHDAAAVVHRLMIIILMSAASRVLVAIPAWGERLPKWTLRRKVQFRWLPIPSTVPVAPVTSERTSSVQQRDRMMIVGHFGTYSRRQLQEMNPILMRILEGRSDVAVRLMGRGSDTAAEELRVSLGTLASRVTGVGALGRRELSEQIQACDVMMQPYPDGVSSRRTTLMAALSHGVPVVTTIGHLTEPFWRESDAVSTVPAGDPDATAERVLSLLNDPAARARLAAAALKTYEQHFSIEHVIDKLRSRDSECLRP